jgi:hypothetical protein
MVRTRVHLDMRRASNNIDTFNRRKSKLVARGVDPRTIAADYQVRKVYLHKNQETKTSELYYLNTLGKTQKLHRLVRVGPDKGTGVLFNLPPDANRGYFSVNWREFDNHEEVLPITLPLGTTGLPLRQTTYIKYPVEYINREPLFFNFVINAARGQLTNERPPVILLPLLPLLPLLEDLEFYCLETGTVPAMVWPHIDTP